MFFSAPMSLYTNISTCYVILKYRLTYREKREEVTLECSREKEKWVGWCRESSFASKSRIMNRKEILINFEVENEIPSARYNRGNLSARAIRYDARNGNNRFTSSCDGANYAYHDFANLRARTSLNALIGKKKAKALIL